MNTLTYSQHIHAKYADEHPDYFSCSKRHVSGLIKKAEAEAEKILSEFRQFYSGDFSIVISAVEHVTCWSIAATFMFNGEPFRTEDPCDLLFIELNECMIRRMIKEKTVCNLSIEGD